MHELLTRIHRLIGCALKTSLLEQVHCTRYIAAHSTLYSRVVKSFLSSSARRSNLIRKLTASLSFSPTVWPSLEFAIFHVNFAEVHRQKLMNLH